MEKGVKKLLETALECKMDVASPSFHTLSRKVVSHTSKHFYLEDHKEKQHKEQQMNLFHPSLNKFEQNLMR